MDDETERESDILGAVTWALVKARTSLSTIEIWHEIYQEEKVPYTVLRNLLHKIAAEDNYIHVKKQVGGYGRRDYFLNEEVRAEIESANG